MYFRYAIDDEIELELQSPAHTDPVFDLVKRNQAFIGAHLAWAQKIRIRADIKRYLARDLLGMADERRWAWVVRYQGQVVGRIGLFVTIPSLQECELYYFLDEDFTGKGIITRAAQAVTDFAFNVLRLRHVRIGFTPHNEKSGAVAERLGFQYEYTLREAEQHGDEWRSLVFRGMINTDWHRRQRPSFRYPLGSKLYLRLHQPYQSGEKFKVLKANQAEFERWFWWANDDFTLSKEQELTRKTLRRYAHNNAIGVNIWYDENLIGFASVGLDVNNHNAHLSYWLDRNARGRGIMTRVTQRLIATTFAHYHAQRVTILAATENTSSRALAERLGMTHELIQRDETLINGRFVDHAQYGLLRDDWLKQREKQV
ncbi:MAG: GNAT family N-acetyltransferase [Anaerolineae bacterium]